MVIDVVTGDIKAFDTTPINANLAPTSGPPAGAPTVNITVTDH